jgi:autotransporter-associated beta strand protein
MMKLSGSMMWLLVALLLPAEASATVYTWVHNGGGDWATPTNWACDVTTGPCAGFPNAQGDQANFTGDVGGLDIFVDRPIRLGAIFFGRHGFRFLTFGGGKFIFDNGLAQASISRSATPTNTPTQIGLLLELQSSLRIETGAQDLFIPSGISGPGGITVDAQSSVFFSASAMFPNTYGGRTTVKSGAIALGTAGGESGVVIPGELVVGDGTGTRDATVFVRRFGVLVPTAPIRVDSDGVLEFQADQHIGDLVMNGTAVVTALMSSLDLSKVTLTQHGGILEGKNGGALILHGDVTASGGVIRGFGAVGIPALVLDAIRRVTVLPSSTLVIENLGFLGDANAGLIKDGSGTLAVTGNGTNTYRGETRVSEGTLSLSGAGLAVPGRLIVGGGPTPAVVEEITPTIDPATVVTVANNGVLHTFTSQAFAGVNVLGGGLLQVDGAPVLAVSTPSFTMAGGHVTLRNGNLVLTGDLLVTSDAIETAVIDGGGQLLFNGDRAIVANHGVQPIDLRIDAPIDVRGQTLTATSLTKRGTGVAVFTQTNPYTTTTTVLEGTLFVNGAQTASPVQLTGGVLGGTGKVGALTALGGRVAPGASPGRLSTGALALSAAATYIVELNGTAAGTQYDQLDVRGSVSLGDAALSLTTSFTPVKNTQFVIIANDGVDPVTGTFHGLAEGATVTAGSVNFTISYRGGDGNDVVLTADTALTQTYYLSEGATGAFFDEDILIANPNRESAPVTLTFSKENGEQVHATRSVPAQSHLTVHVGELAGLEAGSASAQVSSDSGAPLFVERSMFWDKSRYAGHTGTAVDQPARDWFFAEGSQGFFETFVLVINPNTSPTDVTFTFFFENETPVVKTYTVGATTRLTLHAGDIPALVNRSFGISVHGTQPIMAERSMYFGDPQHALRGGSESAGVTAPSTHWFLAEGATGGFFTTFVLLSNPNTAPANVTLQYLLDTGETISVQKTLPANTRLTLNVGAEDDARLHNAAVSTVVTSALPIIAERSMYWAALPWRESHNSFGVVDASLNWGLGEGRTGTPFNYHTYILLANPQTTAANVTVTYLRENGAPVTKTYTVPPTSRFNIDTATIPELHDESFGAAIEVTNNVPIVVERSMYWDANGIEFSGGTNATGIPLPVAPVTAPTP